MFACRGWLEICGDRTLVSPKLKSDFWSLWIVWGIRGNRMGRWPGYGGSGVAYGRMADLWGSAKTYGEMRQACGRMGKPRYHMGRWLVCGRPRNRMGNEGHMKNRNMEAGGGGSVWGPPDRMGSLSQWQTWRDLRTCIFLQQPGAPLGHGRHRTG